MNLFDKKKWSKFLKKYHVAIYSSDTSDTLKSFHVSKPTIIVSIISLVTLFSIFEFYFIKLTPLSKYTGRGELDLKRISQLEEKVKSISIEMFKLQEYTQHLKYALGDSNAKKNGIDPTVLLNEDISDLKNEQILSPSSVIDNRSPKTSLNDNTLNVPFLIPLSNFVISQEFDEEKNHLGIDLAGKSGEVVSAAADGYVIFSDWTNDYGNTILLMHSSKFITVYKHNSSNLKNVGNYVRRGETIALLGSTGKRSTSPHLHFEIWKNGLAKDPLKYLLIKK